MTAHSHRGRRSIRLQRYDYNQPGAYFITLVTHRRRRLFGRIRHGVMHESACGRIVRAAWDSLSSRYDAVATDAFVVMPDHVHGILVLTAPSGQTPMHPAPRSDAPHPLVAQRRAMLLPRVIGYWKMNAAKHINQLRRTPGTRVWQRDYYEHIIRDDRALHRIRAYIHHNPSRWQDDR